jgi:hypothetical protein
VVHHDDLSFLVLVVKELRNVLVLFDAGSREAQGLPDVVLFVLIGVAKVDEEEVSLEANGELLSFDCDGGEVGDLAPGIFLRFVPVVNRLAFLLLVDQFPQSRRFDPPEHLPLLLCHFLGACIKGCLLMNSMSLTVVPVLPASLDSTWSYLDVL